MVCICTYTSEGIITRALSQDVKDSFPGKKFRTVTKGDTCTLLFVDDLTEAEQDTLKAIVESHKGQFIASSLEINKMQKNESIDLRTRGLISEGFIYDSELLSLSTEAQTNAIAMMVASAYLTYPFKITTKDDKEYSMADAAAIAGYYLSGLNAKKDHIDSGRDLKLLVNATTTQAELDVITDNR